MMRKIADELAADRGKRRMLKALVERPPSQSWARHSREELVAEVRRQRDAWELMSCRNQDLPDERLSMEKHAAAQAARVLPRRRSRDSRAVWLRSLRSGGPGS